jgi:hypothetical protein
MQRFLLSFIVDRVQSMETAVVNQLFLLIAVLVCDSCYTTCDLARDPRNIFPSVPSTRPLASAGLSTDRVFGLLQFKRGWRDQEVALSALYISHLRSLIALPSEHGALPHLMIHAFLMYTVYLAIHTPKLFARLTDARLIFYLLTCTLCREFSARSSSPINVSWEFHVLAHRRCTSVFMLTSW